MIKYHILGALCVSTWTDVWFHRLSVFLRNSGALSIREAFPEANLLFFNISPPGGFWRLKIGANESGREEGFCTFIPAFVIPDRTTHNVLKITHFILLGTVIGTWHNIIRVLN